MPGPVIGGLLVDPFGVRVPFLVAGSFALAGMVLLAMRELPAPPIDTQHGLAFDLLRLPRVRAGVLLLRFTVAGLMLFHGVAKLRSGLGGIESLLAAAGLPTWFAAPAVAIGIGLVIERVLPLNASLAAIWVISAFHYYLEGIVWKRGTPHRAHVTFA